MTLSNCSSFTERDLKIIEITGAISSFISILGCLFVIVIMVTYKKYVFSTQRFILYLTISVLLDAMVNVIDGGGYHFLSKHKISCEVIGFIKVYLIWSILLSLLCILIELVLHTICQRASGPIEWVYIPVIFLLPATTTWIPFIHGAYRRVNGECDIQTINPENCTKSTYGLVLKAFLWWIPLYLTISIGGIIYITVLCRLRHNRHKYTPLVELDREIVYQRGVQGVSHLKWYPLLYFAINLIPIVTSSLEYWKPNKTNLTLLVISTIIKGLQGSFIAIVFALDSKTRKRLKWKYFRAAFLQNVLCRENIEEYPILPTNCSDSLKATPDDVNTT